MRLEKKTAIKATTHGMRSYYVNVRRSQGAADSEIALEIGHSSNHQIFETYGEVLPIKIGWKPDGHPAWERFQDEEIISRPKFKTRGL